MPLSNITGKIVIKTIFISLALILSLNFRGYSQVTQAWVQRYTGSTPFGPDEATDIALDTAGNIYVTGSYYSGGLYNYDFLTIKYNSAGNIQWIQKFIYDDWQVEDASIVLDKAGNSYIAGSDFHGHFFTIKYNTTGIQQWYHSFENYVYTIKSTAIDDAGFVYVAGTNGEDFFIIKYNPVDGAPIWTKEYNGPGNSNDAITKIITDTNGYVYVTGYSYGLGTGTDCVTIKYDAATGTEQWVQRYNGSGNTSDGGNDLYIDNTGNVFVIANSGGAGTSQDYLTLKYNSSGVQQWEQRFNGSANGDDFGMKICGDNLGGVYVSGYTTSLGSFKDIATIKYNASGVQQWIKTYNGLGNKNDEANDLSVDNNGNVYITGYSFGFRTQADYVTLKYNSSGILQWEQRYNETVDSSDYSNAIAVDKSGNVYVTGASFQTTSNYDFVTIKYTQPVGINTISNEVPSKYSLSQNYPNPFNPSTNIRFDMRKGDFVTIKIYDMLGKEIENLLSEYKAAGSYEINFDGSKLQSGVYFYKMQTADFIETKRMMLVK